MKQKQKGTVLVVDDEAANLGVLFEFLRQADFKVLVAEDGASALERVKRSQPDIVLLDVKLPDVDGFELYPRLKETSRDEHLPVIFLTVMTKTEDKVRAFDMQAVDYVTKPFEPLEVVARVEKHLLLRSLRRRLEEQNVQLERVNNELTREIAERKRAEKAVRIAAQEWRTTFDAISDMVCLMDAEGKILRCNTAMREFLGKPFEEIIGRPCWELVHGTTERPAGCPGVRMRETCRRESQVLPIGDRWFEIAADPLLDEDGNIIAGVHTMSDVTERKRTEGELRKHRDHLEELVAQRTQRSRALAARLAEAEEAERRQLARELHDQVGQNLTALSLNLKALQQQMPAYADRPQEIADQASARLADSLALIKQTTQRIRDVMDYLRPPALEEYGLTAALRWYGTGFASRTNVPVTVHGEEAAPRLAAAIGTALFRIAQEALTNVARHARATKVQVTVGQVQGKVRMVVADDGIGFDPERPAQPDERQPWGLLTMAERAEAVGGGCRIESSPGQGTQVIVEVTL